jgi:hypothetical protein
VVKIIWRGRDIARAGLLQTLSDLARSEMPGSSARIGALVGRWYFV